MTVKTIEKDKRKIKKLVEGKNFDLLILSIILMDALVIGLMTSVTVIRMIGFELFLLDRLFMAIFIVELLMRMYAYGTGFFKKGWNIFDFCIITLSSFSIFSPLIILRAFRLFRILKYIDRFTTLKSLVNTLKILIPNFVSCFLVLILFFYIFAIIGVWLFGAEFIGFSTLGESLFTLVQVFTLDNWATDIARSTIAMFPYAWVYFIAFLFSSFLIMTSFLVNLIGSVIKGK